MTTLKLYHQPRTRSARVRWLLAELHLPHDVQTVNVFAGEGRNPEYMKEVHPHGFVPALDDEGTVIIESAAICMYLVDRYGKGELAPPVDSKARGLYYEWMVYVPATADPLCESVMFNTVFLPENKRDPKLVERSKKTWIQKVEPRFVRALGTGPFILGEKFSAADVLVGSSLGWARMAGMLSDDPVLAAYLERMTSRPGFLAGFE